MKKKVGCMKIKDSKCPQLYCYNCTLSLDSYFVICKEINNEETLGAGIERLCKPIINKFGDELYSKLISNLEKETSTQAINPSKESWLEKK